MYRLTHSQRLILILCLITSVGRFALDSYLPSLPAIEKDFAIPVVLAEWTLTFYLFGFGLSQLIYGPLSDRYGRRNILLLSFVILILGNLFCAMTTSIDNLITSRFIAGLGGGASGVLNRAIASDYFKGPAFAKAWSYTTTTLVFTLIFAPMVGAYAQAYSGWRGSFVVTAVYVAIIFLLVAKFLPESNQQLNQHALKPKMIWKNYKTLFMHRSFLLNTLCYSLSFSGLIVYFQSMPFLLINQLGLTYHSYIISAVITALSYLLGGFIVNRYVHKLGIKTLLFNGIVLMIISGITLLLSALIFPTHLILIIIPAVLYVIGTRIIIPNATAGALKEFPSMNGSASALIGSLQMISAGIISFIVSIADYKITLELGFTFGSLGLIAMGCFLCLPKTEEIVSMDLASS